jgi:phosphoglucomutase
VDPPGGGVPQDAGTAVQGPIKIFSNHSSTLEGSLALMEDKAKEQVASLELGTMFVLCRNSALHTHIPNIVFTHQDLRMKVAMGKFMEQPAGTDVTKVETSMSFLQIKASIGLHKKIRQVHHEI